MSANRSGSRLDGQRLGCAILGAGQRGAYVAELLARRPDVKVLWLADAVLDRVQACAHRIGPRAKISTRWEQPLDDPHVEAVLIMLPDHLHVEAAEAAFAAGKHVFLEKPIATTPIGVHSVIRAWRTSGRILEIGYVLRYMPFYRSVREVLQAGTLGRVRQIALSEQIGVSLAGTLMRSWHRLSRHTGGLLVHKCCHDLDLICWLLQTRPRAVASFGGLGTFSRPAPAAFCSACPEREGCAFADTGAYEARSPAEQADPTRFGLDRCVFSSDKDTIDNQVLAFEMENEVRGTFALAVQGTGGSDRHISVIGDLGRLDGHFGSGAFTVVFNDGRPPRSWRALGEGSGHERGDEAILLKFVQACLGQAPERPSELLAAGNLFALAAERARCTETVVRLGAGDLSWPDETASSVARAAQAARYLDVPTLSLNAGSNPVRNAKAPARHSGFDPEKPGLGPGVEFTHGDEPGVKPRRKGD